VVLESRWDARLQRDVLYCAPGDMWLSADLMNTLIQGFASAGSSSAPQSPLPAYDAQLHDGIKWYCPGCGMRLNDHLECTRCGHHLRDQLHTLVELHPHRSEGSW
jgi:hypothetical protein